MLHLGEGPVKYYCCVIKNGCAVPVPFPFHARKMISLEKSTKHHKQQQPTSSKEEPPVDYISIINKKYQPKWLTKLDRILSFYSSTSFSSTSYLSPDFLEDIMKNPGNIQNRVRKSSVFTLWLLKLLTILWASDWSIKTMTFCSDVIPDNCSSAILIVSKAD